MKRNSTSVLIIWLTVILFIFAQCKKEAVVPEVVKPVIVPAATEVNYFVWSSMHDIYLWNANIPSLTNNSYLTVKDSLNTFLNKYSSPRTLFNNLLYQYKTVDKWSFIVSDYDSIRNWISGTAKTTGFDFMLYRYSSSANDIFGVVRYVWKGSPAEKAGIQRGDIFSKVDGVQLTVANYTANFINKDSYTLSISKIVNNVVTPTGKDVPLTAITMQEDPVLFSKVIAVNGINVGYLVYNAFNSDFDLELNTVFQQFKSAGVTKLVVDLRYNGGGSTATATYLGSMIYTTNTSKIFSKSVWNSIYATYNQSQTFTDKITSATSTTTPINTLNLSDVYFLVSSETASASELLINGLKPYMNVKSIGTNTYGKYVASVSIYDYALDSKGNLIPDGKGDYVLVTTHKYAMQPIVAKFSNSLGVSDFVTGLTPDITLQEDIGNLLPFGDVNETLLKAALDNIKGSKSQTLMNVSPFANSRSLFGLKDKSQFSHDMYVDPGKVLNRTK